MFPDTLISPEILAEIKRICPSELMTNSFVFQHQFSVEYVILYP